MFNNYYSHKLQRLKPQVSPYFKSNFFVSHQLGDFASWDTLNFQQNFQKFCVRIEKNIIQMRYVLFFPTQ